MVSISLAPQGLPAVTFTELILTVTLRIIRADNTARINTQYNIIRIIRNIARFSAYCPTLAGWAAGRQRAQRAKDGPGAV